MGSRTDLAEREVAEQRARVGSMLGELEERVRSDAHGLGDTLSEHTSGLQERVTGAAEELPGRQALDEQVMRRPLTSLISAVGVGVALGVASSFVIRGGDEGYESERRRAPGRSVRATPEPDDDGGSRLMDTLSGMAMSSLAGPVRHELETLAREAISGFLGERPGDRDRRNSESATERTIGGPSKPAFEDVQR